MRWTGRQFHALDKDLDRLTHAEAAQIYAFRPVWWLGMAVLCLVAGLIVLIAAIGFETRLIAVGAGLIVAGWLGISIGANDASNSIGPAVGAGAIRLLPGVLLIGAAQIAGAALAGDHVAHRLASGIFDPLALQSQMQAQMVMLSALLSAATWITIATAAGLPVSTSHSIVGGIAGAGLAALNFDAIQWGTLSMIASAWVLTPIFAGALAGGTLIFLQIRVLDSADRAAAARYWLPLMVAAMSGLFFAYLIVLTGPSIPDMLALPVGIAVAAIAGVLTSAKLRKDMAADEKVSAKLILRPALVIAAAMMGFASGANDVGNVAGPLSVILGGTVSQEVASVSILILVAAAFSIAVGTVFFGRRLVMIVAGGITRLNPARAYCVTLATAGTVLAASSFGLPVSSTHIAIGGIFGVGFSREWLDRRRSKTRAPLPAEEVRRRILIRRSHVATITAAWLVTVPVTATLGALCCLGLLALTGT